MYRIVRVLLLGLAVAGLVACARAGSGGPLAHVPADTSFLIANLEPLPEAARAALLSSGVDARLRVELLRARADDMEAQHREDLARLYRAIARLFIVKTPSEFETQLGINGNGRFAVYAVGDAVVVRGDLSDPAQFRKQAAALEQAYGHPFETQSVGDVNYDAVPLEDASRKLLIATNDNEFILALVAAKPTSKHLRLILGIDDPDQSVKDAGRLQAITKTNGYGPYVTGYLDTTRLPALWAAGHDTFANRLVGAVVGGEPVAASPTTRNVCQADLARLAARVPLVSFGFTRLDATHQIQQIDVGLAPDIISAFDKVGTDVPALGGVPSTAILDVVAALPITELRRFWKAQTDAVAAKPFTCPFLEPLNATLARVAKMLPRTYLPPVSSLRGLRIAIDALPPEHAQGMQRVPSFRLMVASLNPAGMVGMAKALIPSLADLDLSSVNDPQALPAVITSRLRQPAWVAMSANALAIGVGTGEKDELRQMLEAATGTPGTLAQVHLDPQPLVARWKALQKDLTQLQARRGDAANGEAASGTATATGAADTTGNGVAAVFDHLKSWGFSVRMTDHGLRVTGNVQRQ